MNYDPNDPLGDLLSDDSDDSFFNDDKHRANKKKTHHIINIEEKKSSLFGLEKEKEKLEEFTKTAEKNEPPAKPIPTSKASNDDWLGISSDTLRNEESKLKNLTFKEEPPKMVQMKLIGEPKVSDRLAFLDEPDRSIAADKKPTEGKLSLDDLLGGGNKPQSATKVSEDYTIRVTDYKPSLSGSVRKIDRPSESFKSSKIESKSENKELVTGKRQKSNGDWLGLLGDDKDGDIILGESSENKKDIKQKFSDLLKTQDEKSTSKETLRKTEEINKTDAQIPQSQENFYSFLEKSLEKVEVPGGNALLADADGASILQQQESHLMVALQLKAQEERLAAMHERQKETKKIQHEVVQGHREHLDKILHGQMEQRVQLQGIIEQHQKRINHHIQSLLQPTKSISETQTDIYQEHKQANDSIDKRYTENDQLQQLISILKENHDKEIEIMESSFRRQILHVSDSLDQIENRLKAENEKLGDFYVNRISKLEDENMKISEDCESKIKQMSEKFDLEKKKMEEKHLDDIGILQKQHRLIVENIRNSISQEYSTLTETKSYSEKLSTAIHEIDNNNKMCKTLMENVESLVNSNANSRSKDFQIKEEQINRLLDNLERQRNLYELEIQDKRSSLLVQEERLKQQMNLIEDERNVLKNKQSSIFSESENSRLEYEALKKRLEMEKEIFQRNVEIVEKSNEGMKAELDEKYKNIEIETKKLANEKKVISDTKEECQNLRMTLKKELKEVDEMKSNFKIEQERHQEKESKLIERSRELEVLTISALAKRKHAEEKLVEANFLQKKYQEKLNKIQEQTLSLNIREKEIAKDKIALSRERLTLYNQQSENNNSVCNLCKNALLPPNLINNIGGQSNIDNLLISNADPDNMIMNNFGDRINSEKFDFLDKNITVEDKNVSGLRYMNDIDSKENMSYSFHTKYI